MCTYKVSVNRCGCICKRINFYLSMLTGCQFVCMCMIVKTCNICVSMREYVCTCSCVHVYKCVCYICVSECKGEIYMCFLEHGATKQAHPFDMLSWISLGTSSWSLGAMLWLQISEHNGISVQFCESHPVAAREAGNAHWDCYDNELWLSPGEKGRDVEDKEELGGGKEHNCFTHWGLHTKPHLPEIQN